MTRFAAAAFLTALLSSACPAIPDRPVKPRPRASERAGNPRLDRFFAALKAGHVQVIALPRFGWDDVPALLRRANSTTRLRTVPSNPLSSYAQRECSEGMVALWLIEGVRRGGRYPSLNPLCLSRGDGGKVRDWEAASEGRRQELAQRYRAGWRKVRTLPRAKAAAIDPLRGCGLVWH